jgi:HEAT repeat protein
MVISLAPGEEEELAAAYAPIVRDLDDPDAAVRALAFAALIQNPPRFLEPLILRLAEGEQVSPGAITGLKRLGTTRAKEKLAALARNHPAEGLRQQAIGALGVLGDEASCSTALEVVEASEEYSRWIALRAAGHLCSDKALPTIMRFVMSADPAARAEAAFALGNTRSALAIPPLIRTLSDSDEHVRYVASQSLFTLTHRRSEFSTSEPAGAALAQQDWIDWWLLNSPTARIYSIEDCGT